jgi:hypothetical protein
MAVVTFVDELGKNIIALLASELPTWHRPALAVITLVALSQHLGHLIHNGSPWHSIISSCDSVGTVQQATLIP